MGEAPGVKGFIALIIGGLVSPLGALTGGLPDVSLTREESAIVMDDRAYFDDSTFVTIITVLPG